MQMIGRPAWSVRSPAEPIGAIPPPPGFNRLAPFPLTTGSLRFPFGWQCAYD